MANPEHLTILKQGVAAWNEWRQMNLGIRPDLNEANLEAARLSMVDLRGVDLNAANLSGADLFGANLFDVDLSRANLIDAALTLANLFEANLFEADLNKANLSGANLNTANLSRANLSEARVGRTLFAEVDLSTVRGLDTVEHWAPSTIGIDTLYRSKGQIPEVFLRGCGVPEDFIARARSLVTRPIQYYTCFISYSTKDDTFAKRLYANLQQNGVRCWFAPEDIGIGDKFRTSIDEAIRVYDKLLIVLSENSIGSPWVESEVEAAFEKERKRKKLVLFPIRLDDAIKRTRRAWAADIRRTRHIGDFRDWQVEANYQRGFKRLLRDLQAETSPPPPQLPS